MKIIIFKIPTIVFRIGERLRLAIGAKTELFDVWFWNRHYFLSFVIAFLLDDLKQQDTLEQEDTKFSGNYQFWAGDRRHQKAVSCYRCRLNSIGIPMLKITRSRDRLIFNMGIPYMERQSLYWDRALVINVDPSPLILQSCCYRQV